MSAVKAMNSSQLAGLSVPGILRFVTRSSVCPPSVKVTRPLLKFVPPASMTTTGTPFSISPPSFM